MTRKRQAAVRRAVERIANRPTRAETLSFFIAAGDLNSTWAAGESDLGRALKRYVEDGEPYGPISPGGELLVNPEPVLVARCKSCGKSAAELVVPMYIDAPSLADKIRYGFWAHQERHSCRCPGRLPETGTIVADIERAGRGSRGVHVYEARESRPYQLRVSPTE